MIRIVIVDDKEENLYLLRALLTGHGHEVIEARHGAEALVKARQSPPELIISDLLMPVMDGYTLLRHWKADDRLKQIPFIVYTATYTEPRDEKLALDLGADAFILKPAEPESFLARLREVLAKSESHEPTPARAPEGEERVVLKEYSEALVRKLEEKTLQLEQKNRELQANITECKQVEAALRESEERLRAIFEQAPLGIAEGHIASADYVQINQRYADIVGYPIEELKKMTFRDITHPEDLDKDLELFLQLSQGKLRFYTIEKRYLRKDRAVVWVNITVSAIAREGGGKPQYCMAVIEDITEKKRLEAQLRQSQKMEAIGQLSGGIAHDFNNILTVIKGRVSLLQSTPDFTAEVTESVGEIADAANRAAALTRQLLAFSRRQVMQQQDLDLHELVRGMSVLLRRLLGEQISVGLEFSDTPIWTHADRALLEQVLLNLAINARDAMPQGGQLEISIASRDVTADEAARWTQATAGRFAVLSVRDTGTGIAADVLPHIFEPFFTTKDVGEGTGLGLATVYGIVQQHSGGIEVESTIGFGTVFHVFLPLVEAPMPTEKPTEAKARPVSGTETILLVEDELAVQQIAQLVLQRLGYRVLTADDGRAALDVWRKHRDAIHLLLTDLVMPAGISGQELAKQLIAEKPALRIIYTSGYSASIAGKDFQLDGKANFLGKPYDPLQLSAMVRKTLDAKPNKPPFV